VRRRRRLWLHLAEAIVKRLLIAAAAVALAACSAPDRGEVTDREFEPAHTTMESHQSCLTDSKGRQTCTTQYQPRYYGDSWTIEITDHKADESGWRDVTPEEYDRCQIGDEWPECGKPEA